MLGDKIKLYRENKKMTQNNLADILEVSASTVSKYESGALEPSIESLKRLAELFEISIDELLKEDNFDISKVNIFEILREQKNMKLKGNLYHNTQITFAYNTNHIEGSKLTEDQTRYIYETNTLLAEKDSITDLDDVLETANHFKLVDYMLDIADEKLTEKMKTIRRRERVNNNMEKYFRKTYTDKRMAEEYLTIYEHIREKDI